MSNINRVNIVGAGLYGLTLGRLLMDAGIESVLYERSEHLGGMVRTDNVNGIEIHKHGAHIFHTDYDEVIEFVTKFTEFTKYKHRVFCNIEYLGKEKLVEIPLSLKTLSDLYDETDPEILRLTLGTSTGRCFTKIDAIDKLIGQCSWDLYEYILKPYTENQWGIPIQDVPGFILDRIKFKDEFVEGYFTDKFQGIPKIGYKGLVEKISEGLNIEYNKHLYLSDLHCDYSMTVWTADICDSLPQLPKLPYRSLDFINKTVPKEYTQKVAVVNYPNKEYTRVIDHSMFRPDLEVEGDKVITYEFPKECKDGDTKFYPIGNELNDTIYKNLKESILSKYPNTIFGGRLGSYAYYDMDDTIFHAMQTAKLIIEKFNHE